LAGTDLSRILSVLGDDVMALHGPSAHGSIEPVALDAGGAPGGLSFCNDRSGEASDRVAQSAASVVICHDRVAAKLSGDRLDKTLIAVANPRLAYIKVVESLYPREVETGIHSSAHIHPSVDLGDGVHVGANSVIDADCHIGDSTTIDSNVRIYSGTRIGRNVHIFAGAVLGADGFGFERDPAGKVHRFPQRGHVVIEDDVEIGANVCIDRAAMQVTRIGAGTKIDNLAYVAHNVQIGRDCLIMASSVIAGSSIVGDGVEISPGAVVRDKTTIGDEARIGLGAVVVADVPGGVTVAGVPAKPFTGHGRS